MTRQEIDGLEVGVLMDSCVAEEVMRWEKVQYPGGIYWDEGKQGPIPGGKFSPRFSGSFKPSTDISAAWEVLSLLEHPVLGRPSGAPPHLRWFCRVRTGPTDRDHVCGDGETAPLAICRAALAAVETDGDDPNS